MCLISLLGCDHYASVVYPPSQCETFHAFCDKSGHGLFKYYLSECSRLTLARAPEHVRECRVQLQGPHPVRVEVRRGLINHHTSFDSTVDILVDVGRQLKQRVCRLVPAASDKPPSMRIACGCDSWRLLHVSSTLSMCQYAAAVLNHHNSLKRALRGSLCAVFARVVGRVFERTVVEARDRA